MADVPTDLDSLKILHYPHPVLKQTADPVADPTDLRVAALVERMRTLMYEAEGIGLAAPQVGVSLRIVLANPSHEPGQEITLINPEFVETEGWQDSPEGCLSVPGLSVNIRRRQRIAVAYLDLEAQPRRIEASGHAAAVFQHECDHLDGKLIVNRLGLVGRLAARDALRRLEDDFAGTTGK